MLSTLFGHLATRLGEPENLATEALGYILRKSLTCRQALGDLLTHNGMSMDGNLLYRNQASGQDQGVPDVVGLDGVGQQRLILEAKFWAGLTDHQPITYLGRLPKDGGVLLFVVPDKREVLVWNELLRRCEEAGLKGTTAFHSSAVRRHALSDGSHLALVSWRNMLGGMHARVQVEGDRNTENDLIQLLGLCSKMDSESFLPLTGEELTTTAYRRVVQFSEMIDDIVPALVKRGVASKNKGSSRLTTGSEKGIYGRYMYFHGHGAFVACDLLRWTSLAPTPLWLTMGHGFAGGCAKEVRDVLAPLASTTPPRMFLLPDTDYPTLPLYVSPGLSKQEVMAEVMQQLEDIGQLIAHTTPGAHEEPGSETSLGTGEVVV